jgi:hypothetical protein
LEIDRSPRTAAQCKSTSTNRPFVSKAIAGKHWIARKSAAYCPVMTSLVEQRENQCIYADEWMKGEPTI